jgi:hypothetical protein
MKKTVCLIAILVSSCVINAQYAIVEKQVLRIGVALASNGYELTHDIKFASLNNGMTDNYYFSLSRGWEYKIFAVCDGDCGDIDLCMYDENDNRIDCDQTKDDKPVVSVSPKWSGRFRLWVKMYECRINPCRFGIAIFGK